MEYIRCFSFATDSIKKGTRKEGNGNMIAALELQVSMGGGSHFPSVELFTFP